MDSSVRALQGVAGSADAAYAVLRERLARGDHAPGERLTEVALAEELGISRTPVREAIRRLQADGLLVRTVRGVAVAVLTPEELSQLYALRAALEALSARLAAERQRDGMLAPSTIAALEQDVERVAAAVRDDDVRGTVQGNLRLHKGIAGAAGNHFLEEALQRIWDRIAVSSQTNLTNREWARTITAQHRAILGAVKHGDPEAAERAAREHIEAAGRAHRE